MSVATPPANRKPPATQTASNTSLSAIRDLTTAVFTAAVPATSRSTGSASSARQVVTMPIGHAPGS